MTFIMKQKGKQRVISIIMAIAMVITSLQIGVTTGTKTAEAETTLYPVAVMKPVATTSTNGYPLPYAEENTDAINGRISVDRETAGLSASSNATQGSLYTAGWDTGDYYQLHFKTSNFENLTFTAKMCTVAAVYGKTFQLQYSTDGTNYTDLTNGSFSSIGKSYSTIGTYDLPASLANKADVYIRVVLTSEGCVNYGNTRIGNIEVKGTPVEGYTPPETEKPVVPAATTSIDPILPDDVAAVTGGALTISEVNAKEISATPADNIVTVIGQVATVYGSKGNPDTTILEDIIDDGENGKQIVGLQVYQFDATSAPYNFKAGDVIVLKGTLSEYGGVKQIKEMDASSVQLYDSREAIPAQEIAWSNVMESKDYYVSEYVVFNNATVVTPSPVKVNDASGAAIQFSSEAPLPEKAVANDKLSVYGVISKYNTSYQLRTGTTESSYVGVFTGTEPTPTPLPSATPAPIPEPVYDPISDTDFKVGELNIKEALSKYDTIKGTDVTILGQVAYIYGSTGSLNTAIIQDVIDGEIVGLQVYKTNCQVGDVVRVTGKITEYNGVIQMPSSSTVSVIRSDSAFLPQTVTIAELNNNISEYQSEYVKIKDVILGKTNGSYTTITDNIGNSINIYKSAAYPSDMQVGDKATVLAVATANTYNGITSSQLRNGTTETSFVGDSVIDNSIILPIASFDGSIAPKAPTVYADKNTANDGLDTSSELTLSTGAIPVVNNANIGSKGLIKDDYYQIKTSSYGYGAMKLSFTMKGSATGAKNFVIEYSTDGTNFSPVGAGSNKYTVAVYENGVLTSSTDYDIACENGAFSLGVDGKYHVINFTLPKEANHEKNLYIRLRVTDNTSIKGAVIATSGTNYLTSIKLTGSPIEAADMCNIVKATPTEGKALLGQEILLATTTSGAAICYSFDGENYSLYDEDSKPSFTELPSKLTVYAKKQGVSDSIKVTYSYTQAKVSTPKISPNGGAVVAGTEVKISTETEGTTIQYSTDNGATWNTYTEKIKLDTFPTTILAKATKEGCLDSEIKSASFTQRTSSDYNVYFGQIHAHTNISDGAGSIETAFDYAKNTAEHIDFLAVTDHSNSIGNLNDTKADGINVTIKDASANEEWKHGHEVAKNHTDDTFVGIYGYEMTWSGGAPGHMNTFNTEGFLSRNQDGYKNGSASSLPNYYAQLKTVPDSISQFNHPGTTFGDFYDFGYYDSEIDPLITLVEVGNGEGAIGSSGYFPSYQYYTRALDKGWHVAPTNNQDNHKGKWGDANTGRTVILADTLTEESIYDALRNMRTYATEDNDLEIQYTLNNAVMGTIFDEKPDDVSINVKLKDPSDSKIGKVEVIVNGGLSVASEDVLTNQSEVKFDLKPSYSYYYIRVTQADGDIAVTAPVWISKVESVGISGVKTSASLAVKDEALDITTTLYNNETQDFNVDSIVYSVKDKVVHTVDLTKETGMAVIKTGETPSYTFGYTHDGLGSTNIDVTVKGTLNGVEKVYKDVLKLNYVDPSMVTRVIIDGTHNNDYVTGYYGGNVGNFADIAAEDNVQVSVVTDEITEAMLANCSLLIISAPAKKSGTYNNADYGISHFEDKFVDMVANYAKNGGNVILCGLADYQDSDDCQSSTEINKLLSAMGATTRLNSDELCDDVNNGGQAYRLYLTNYNMNSKYTKGIQAEQQYSAYSGAGIVVDKAAVAAGTAEPLVYGHSTTYSLDSKSCGDNYVSVATGDSIVLAHETIGSNGGDVFVGGTVFISNFEVKTDLDNASQLPYANKNILLNILKENKKRIATTDINTVRQGEMGEPYAIEGYVTAGTAQAGNIFFDTIYVQDDTAGITIFPIAEPGIKVGQKIRIEGFIDEYQGDKELQVINYELLDGAPKVYEPLEVSTKDAMDYEKNGGRLVKVTGKITKIEIAADDLKYIHVVDESGVEAIVFTDGYITDSTGYKGLINDLAVGMKVSAVGLVYTNPDGVCLRVRDRAEIVTNRIGGPVISKPEEPKKPEVPSAIDKVQTNISAKTVTATQKDNKFYSNDGKKITDAIVKTESGEKYIVDKTGEKIVSAMVETKNGTKYIVAETGVVVTGQIVNTNGAKFYTTKSSGKVVTDQLIKISGQKYYATESGAFATGLIVTVNGDKYYTTKKSGKIVTDKLFKLKGNKYIATSSGKLAVSTWISIDGKDYYCNKDGIVTKTR